MKRLLAFWKSLDKFRFDKSKRSTLATGLAIAVGLAGVVQTAQGDPQCGAFDAASVDENFLL